MVRYISLLDERAWCRAVDRGSFTMHSHETGDPFNHILALLKKTAVNAELCSDKHRYDEA